MLLQQASFSDTVSAYLHEEQPLWVRGAVVSLLVLALLHWGNEIWLSYSNGDAGKKGKKVKGSSSQRGGGGGDEGKVFEGTPASQKSNGSPVSRVHSMSSGFLDLDEKQRPGLDIDSGEDKPRATCGLFTSKVANVEKFGKALQRMIRRCRTQRASNRIRIFDDCTVNDNLDESTAMQLTETRCTQFKRLRQAAHITEESYESSMCDKPFSGGKMEAAGKSGSFFMRTHDNKYVLKTIEEHEFVCLKDVLPHMVLFLETHEQSLLCRFLGAYSLDLGGTALTFVVMANALPRKADDVYDLKGTTEDRWVDPSSKGVLKDQNFNVYNHKMFFPGEIAHSLIQQIQDDAEFLHSLGVMDYSLLVGVTPASKLHHSNGGSSERGATILNGLLERSVKERKGTKTEVVFQLGIIDYLQRWTPKKVAAHWLKKTTLGCFHEIDTEPPAVYYKRFYKYLVGRIQSIDNEGR